MRPWTVLIVDDSPDDRLDIKAALRNASTRSFAFVEAGTIQEAITALKDARFDCIVLDFNLPDGTAFDLLDVIPHETAFDGLTTQLREPVVVITDGADTRTGRRVLEKGAQEFVPKGGVTGILPFVVARAVDTAVERHALAGQVIDRTRELRASEERLRLAETAAGIGVWDWDIKTDQVVVSHQYRALYGLGTDEEVSYERWLHALVHPDDREAIVTAGKALFDGLGDYRVEFRIVHPQLGVRWVAGEGRLIRDADGRPSRFIGVNVDITERQQSRLALVEADRQKDAFIAFVAHELRNPLAPIRAAAAILRTHPNEQSLAKCSAVIERQVTQLTRLLNDLIDVSRIAHDTLSLQLEDVSLSDVISAAIETCQALLDSRTQVCVVDIADEAMAVHADRARLVQIVVNLLNNAAKYSDPGSRVWVTVRTNHSHVTVSVKDEGPGLDADLLPRIFQPFTRGPGQSMQTPDGLGVGLTLVKRLAELHGGNVTALSAGPGRGSEFIVSLPAANDRDEERPLRCGAGADTAPSVDRSVVGKDTDAALA
jgi:PAS domain S-box-containing protein